jgi:Cys-rich repeat protein
MDCDCIDWCEGTCVQVQPVECWSDYDCPAGFICQYSEDTNCWYGDGNGDGLYNCGGVCVPGAVDCFSDADCAPGFACQYDPDSYCWYEGDEDEPQSDMPAYCGGICVPKECKPVPCPAGFVFDQASCECVNVQNTCVVSGCSGEVCGSVPIATNCIWEPWFICYSQQFTTCGPYGPDGTCMWEPTAEFYACMSQFFG